MSQSPNAQIVLAQTLENWANLIENRNCFACAARGEQYFAAMKKGDGYQVGAVEAPGFLLCRFGTVKQIVTRCPGCAVLVVQRQAAEIAANGGEIVGDSHGRSSSERGP